MGIISWIITGCLVGLIGPKLMKYKGNILINIVVGIIGGFIGGLLVGLPAGAWFYKFNYSGVMLSMLLALFFVGLVNYLLDFIAPRRLIRHMRLCTRFLFVRLRFRHCKGGIHEVEFMFAICE